MEWLNEKLADKDKITYNKYRPNIVIDIEIQPFEEDRYRELRLGNVFFRMIDYCGRCKSSSIVDG